MPLKWRKVWISDETFESAEVIYVNNDGVPDIVSGAYWYQGPDFRKKHSVGEVKGYGEYFDDFSTIPLDINGDGFTDFVTGGWSTRCAGGKTPEAIRPSNGPNTSSLRSAMLKPHAPGTSTVTGRSRSSPTPPRIRRWPITN